MPTPSPPGWEARLERYRREGSASVPGWLSDQVFEALAVTQRLHDSQGVTGALYEIGVYAGRFLLALEQLRRPDERLVGIDLFELPLATDGPRPEGRAAVLAALERCAQDPTAAQLIAADSTTLEAAALLAAHGPARVVSVDGDHRPPSVMADLALAAALLAPGGVVFLDDCFNPLFPGVQEGLARYLLGGARTLAPVGHFGNKLLLVEPAGHDVWFKTLLARLGHLQLQRRARGEPALLSRRARCWGWPIVALRSDDW